MSMTTCLVKIVNDTTEEGGKTNSAICLMSSFLVRTQWDVVIICDYRLNYA